MTGFILLPQAVHFVFSKNCILAQRGFWQRTIKDAPHASHPSCTKVCLPQVGQ